ncbi:MAG: isocitrate lyase/PEP mutase family protein [Rhodospirillales bacterium]|jgi:2-methylisocitrate lyase-like PEP mutase family enzyme|nr:isocitrate lyase/PEP mutase family protein [Rhodospirillales bacterium]
MKRGSFRQVVASHDPLVLIGAHDGLSARLIEQAGYPAFFIGGFPLVGARYGVPDIGIKGLGEIAAGVRDILGATNLPVLMDGDDGYGDVKNVFHTIRTYEDMGVGAIMIEDQTWPKRCGHMAGKNVVDAAFMIDKVQAAVGARRDPDTMIVARTDARTVHGLDEALRRARAYVEAGADAIFVEAPETEEELAIVGGAFDVPQLANPLEGGRTPILPPERLNELGFNVIIYGISLILRITRTMKDALEDFRSGEMKQWGTGAGFEEYKQIVGFDDWASAEKEYASANE